jgi:hypothetical protein
MSPRDPRIVRVFGLTNGVEHLDPQSVQVNLTVLPLGSASRSASHWRWHSTIIPSGSEGLAFV